MKYQILLLLIGLTLASCIPAQPPAAGTALPTLSSTTPSLPAETSTSVPTAALTSTPLLPPAGREIALDGSGGEKLTGTVYGDGQTAIILANMSIGGEKQWNPFVAAVDKEKFTTLTFNYRDVDDVAPDMDLILSWLTEEGFERVICIGASLGTRACSTIAREPELVGIVLIAGPVHHASVAETTYPKLFIAGALDVWAFDIQMGYEKAAEPKELKLFEDTRAHGTDLFASQDSEPFLTLLIDFVNGLENP